MKNQKTQESFPHCGKPIKHGEDHHCEDAIADKKAA